MIRTFRDFLATESNIDYKRLIVTDINNVFMKIFDDARMEEQNINEFSKGSLYKNDGFMAYFKYNISGIPSYDISMSIRVQYLENKVDVNASMWMDEYWRGSKNEYDISKITKSLPQHVDYKNFKNELTKTLNDIKKFMEKRQSKFTEYDKKIMD